MAEMDGQFASLAVFRNREVVAEPQAAESSADRDCLTPYVLVLYFLTLECLTLQSPATR